MGLVKHEPVVAVLGEACQVPLNDRDDQAGDRYDSVACPGLGRYEREAAAADLGDLAGHPHRAGGQVGRGCMTALAVPESSSGTQDGWAAERPGTVKERLTAGRMRPGEQPAHRSPHPRTNRRGHPPAPGTRKIKQQAAAEARGSVWRNAASRDWTGKDLPQFLRRVRALVTVVRRR